MHRPTVLTTLKCAILKDRHLFDKKVFPNSELSESKVLQTEPVERI